MIIICHGWVLNIYEKVNDLTKTLTLVKIISLIAVSLNVNNLVIFWIF